MAAYFTIGVLNSGAYVAKFSVTYTEDGKTFEVQSGDFTAGVKKTARLPGDATGIYLEVDDEWFIASWRNIFTKQWDSPPADEVCYEIGGTTLNPSWKQVDC